MQSRVTVVTPTYNRAHTLDRVFNSLKSQNYREFEWLIIDDGSTDNTSELVKKYINEARFTIKYIRQEHLGKYAAVNLSYKLVTTPYIINLDSDDEFLSDGLMKIMRAWECIPKEKYNNIWCVTGRCIDSNTKKMVGKPFPNNINNLEGIKQKKVLFNISGEKHSCRRVDIVSKFPFPEFPDTNKLVPNMSWTRINAIYDQYCINDIISVYYQNSPDSLAKSPSKERKLGYYYYAVMCINDFFNQFFYNPDVRWSLINISRCGWKGGKLTKEIINEVNGFWKRIFVIMFMPLTFLYNNVRDLSTRFKLRR